MEDLQDKYCINEWCRGICDKKKYKCTECPSRSLAHYVYGLTAIPILKDGFHPIIWYGSINILGYATVEDKLVRGCVKSRPSS